MFSAHTAFAQSFSNVVNNPSVSPLIGRIMDLIVIPLVTGLFILAALIFIWGIFKMISKAGEPTARAEGQQHVLWGVVGMAIMVSVYGIIRFIANTLNVGDPFR